VRAVAVHADVIVVVSGIWQTTCTAVRSGDEGFVIDSPVLPDELDALPGLLEQAGFPVSGLLATHADWDHLLGRLAFPGVSLGCAESSAARLHDDPGAAQRALRDWDDEHYVSREKPLALSGVQPLPVPGKLSLGSEGVELELHPAAGHTADGAAFWLAWAQVLVCGDYLSPVEIPMVGHSVIEYIDTLERLSPLVDGAATVVPGHGAPLSGPEARRLLDEDIAYLRALETDAGAAPLPSGRRTAEQKRIHAQNATRLTP
jgi:glyoxylase-like metal-dependent hydrolase (beta-lactamase superfamily II)